MPALDVPTNWRRWTGWLAGRGQPDPHEGIPSIITPERAVLITDAFELTDMRAWLQANTRDRVAFYGRWDFLTHAFRVDRTLIGLNIVFDDVDEAFHAKMRWG